MIDKPGIDRKKTQYEDKERNFRDECTKDEDFRESITEWRNDIMEPYLGGGFPEGFKLKVLPLPRIAVENAVNSSMAGEIPDINDSLQLDEDEEPSEEQARKLKITETFHKAFVTEVVMRTS